MVEGTGAIHRTAATLSGHRLAIAALAGTLAVLVLAAALIGAYPISPGELAAAVARRLTGAATRGPDRHRAVRGTPAAGAGRSAGRGCAGGRRGSVPDAVPQSAGLTGHPGRLHRRGAWRRARHLPVAARPRHPAHGLRHGTGDSGPGLRRCFGRTWPRSDPGAGAGRRGGRLARGCGHLAPEDPRRSLRSAPCHRVLAARQLLRHPQSRGVGDAAHDPRRAAAAPPVCAGASTSSPWATRRRRRSAWRRGACASPSSPPPR